MKRPPPAPHRAPAPTRPRGRRLVAALGLAGACAGAVAGECVDLRGGELVFRASEACKAQIRRDPALRRAVVETIDRHLVAAGPAPGAAPAAPAAPAREAGRPGARSHGLTHPLARLSALNAQSRYLGSLGNPAPTYYGQTAAP